MSMTGQDVVNRAQVLLNDSGNPNAQVAANTRWPLTELLLWVTDAQREAVIVSPNSNNGVIQIQLVAGTRQTLPTASDGWLLLSIKRNLTTANQGVSFSGGRAVRQTTQEILDAYEPNWHTDATAAAVQNYTFDVQDRKSFYVYPPNDGTGWVEANVSLTPPVVTSLTQTLPMDDIYLGALASYVCYRALMKDAEFAGGSTLAMAFYQQFYQSMSSQDTSENSDSANSTFSTPAPSKPVIVPPPQGRK